MSDRRRRKKVPLTLSPDQRMTIEAEIERLIGILDAADPDPDLEETGDLEPSLGSYNGQHVDAELDRQTTSRRSARSTGCLIRPAGAAPPSSTAST